MSEDLGLSPQAATLAFGFGTPAPTAPARTWPPVAPSPVEPHSDRGRSPESVTMAEWIKEDLAKGKLTRTRRSTNWARR